MARAARPTLLAVALLGAAALGGCQLAPLGSCETDLDCDSGRHCAEQVCVFDGRSSLYAACVVDRDCDPYAECMRGVCVLSRGRCAEANDCAAWESCEENVCRPLGGRCTTVDDCQAWEQCVAAASTNPPLPEHRCAVVPGRCASSADCASWQRCDAAHFCETGPGFCAGAADCRAWEACGTTSHVCAPQPGRCAVEADCAAWQDCAAGNTCVTAPGFCAGTADCSAPDACGADHVCALPAGACRVQDDCAPPLVCEANACVAQPLPPTLDPAVVFLVGTVQPGTPGRAGIAPLGSATEKLVGLLPGDGACGARIGTDGSVLLTRGPAALAALVADPFLWEPVSDGWSYPTTPEANDVAVVLPLGCEAAATASFVLQAGTGARLVDCGGLDWRDASGAVVVSGQPLIAWSADGLKLAGAEGMIAPPALLDAAGAPVAVTGLPAPPADRLLAGWRATATGFRLVLTSGASPQLASLEVWDLAAGGAATLVGALPALPADVTEVDPPVLDAAGDVFQLGRTAGGDVVVRRTPGGSAAIVHDERTLPAPGPTLLDARVHAADGPCLVTGP